MNQTVAMNVGGTNRIQNAIDAVQISVEQMPHHERDRMHKSFNIDFDEYCAFQNAKSHGQAMGRLTLEEAQTVYNVLGSGPRDFNSRSQADKIVVTKMIAELMK